MPFSKGVSCLQRECLTGMLQMRQVNKHQKYLGIPTISGRSKKLVFRDLLDRMWKKLRGWNGSIPAYLMGVYKIPATIIQVLHYAMARFWWGGKGLERKMHWLN